MNNTTYYKALEDSLRTSEWILDSYYKIESNLKINFRQIDLAEHPNTFQLSIEGDREIPVSYDTSGSEMTEEVAKELLSLHVLKDLARRGICGFYDKQMEAESKVEG